MFALAVLCAAFCLQVAQGDNAGLEITAPQLKTAELQGIAQQVLDQTDAIRKKALALVNSADDEVLRLNAILVSYKTLVTDLQSSKPSCGADDVSVTSATFERCTPNSDTIDSIIGHLKETAQSALDQLQVVDDAVGKITDPTQTKLAIAETNWFVCSEFYHTVTSSNSGINDERYSVQSCVDETSAQLRGQVQVNLRKVKDCLAQND